MPELKVAIHLPSLRQPFKKALHTAAQLGASAVEIDVRNQLQLSELSGTGVRQLRKMLEDLNLRVAAVSFITRRGYDVLEDLTARVEATKAAMKFAYQMGASVVINCVGRIPSDETDPQWTTLIEVLTELGNYGQHVGAFLAARTVGVSDQELARLIDALPEGSLGVDFDPGGLIINGFTPLSAIEKLGSSILHVHARDAVRDLAQGRGLETPLGRGEAEFAALAGMLGQIPYRGYFTLERSGENAVFEIGEGVKYLKTL